MLKAVAIKFNSFRVCFFNEFQTVIFYSGFAVRKEIFHEFFHGKFAVSRLLRVRRQIFLKFVQNFFGLLNAIKNYGLEILGK